MRPQKVADILSRLLYTGYVESSDWKVSRRPGQHEALISYETHKKILRRMQEASYAPARKNLSVQFPLRGVVACVCGTPLRGGSSKGRSKYYAYYLCQNKSCERYGKSIKREEIEGDFEKLLEKLTPSKPVLNGLMELFKDKWEHETKNHESRRAMIEQKLVETEGEIELAVTRVLESNNDRVITAFEERVEKLEDQKIEYQEKLKNFEVPAKHFD